MEPRYNEGPRDWQNWLSIPNFRYTVEPRYNEPLDNENLSITNDFVFPSNSKKLIYMKKNHYVSRGTQQMFSLKCLIEKQILPRIFYYLRTAKNFWMSVVLMYNFRSLLWPAKCSNIQFVYIVYVIFLLSGLYRSYVLRDIRFRSFAVLCG